MNRSSLNLKATLLCLAVFVGGGGLIEAPAHAESNGVQAGKTSLASSSSKQEAEPFKFADVNPALPAKSTSAKILDLPKSGSYNIRIPAITVASNGDILASYDLRHIGNGNTGGDAPNANSIVQRRSTDGGKTWGDLTYIQKASVGSSDGTGRKGYSDPSYVVDHTTGKIFNFHVYSQKAGVFTNNHGYTYNSQGEINQEDENSLQMALSVSSDNGYTWENKIITDQVLRDKASLLQACFVTSGTGTQKMQEPNAGRLLVQAACVLKGHSTKTPKIVAMTVYSDDHGDTWKSGNFTDLYDNGGGYFDENKVAELSDGRLILNSRSTGGSSNYRRIAAISYDGGITWKDYRTQEELVDPRNNASIIRAFPNASPGTLRSKVLIFSNTKTVSSTRNNGTIWISYDDGETWSVSKTFNAGATGYTTMAVQPDGSIGLLYEPKGWNGVAYYNFTLQWLDPTLPTEPKISLGSTSGLERSIIDGESVNIPLEISGDDPLLKNTVSITGLPEGLSFNESKGAVVGTPRVGNKEVQYLNIQVTFSESDDGTGVPRVATTTSTIRLNPGDLDSDSQNQNQEIMAPGEFTGDSSASVIAIDSSGYSYLYKNGTTYLKSENNDFANMTYVVKGGAGDLDGDAGSYVIGVDTKGDMYTFNYLGQGNFDIGQKIGHNWGSMDQILTISNLSNGSAKYLIARNKLDNSLWSYEFTSAGLSNGRRIGSRWGAIKDIIDAGDGNSDEHSEALAIDNKGFLWLYLVKEDGSIGEGVQIGRGWNSYSKVFSPGDINGDGKSDLLALRSDGTMVSYIGSPDGGFIFNGQFGSKFDGYKAIL